MPFLPILGTCFSSHEEKILSAMTKQTVSPAVDDGSALGSLDPSQFNFGTGGDFGDFAPTKIPFDFSMPSTGPWNAPEQVPGGQ
jgi:hypothetical protein